MASAAEWTWRVVLVADAEVLLLDEPTNHLDVVAITWLVQSFAETFCAQRGSNGWLSLMIVGFWMKFATACGSA